MDTEFLTGSSSREEREKQDFYPTPSWATQALLQREAFEGVVWEPACGNGAISVLLGPQAISTDLYDRGFGESGVDFLWTTKKVDHIVTNPPYKLAQEFVEHALQCADKKVAMLLKLNFLEGQRRKEFFEQTPLKKVYVFSKRVSFGKGNEKAKGGGILAYAWFVWDNQYKGNPEIGWI
jgi:hypothetical protein